MLSEEKTYLLGAIYLNLTDCCNLKCRHCWLSPETINMSFQDGEKRLTFTRGVTLSQMEDVITQAIPLGLQLIKLTGGEPFLRSDIIDFIELFHYNGLNVHIETNGTLIDESTAKKLKQYKVRQISVSLDSADSKIHDSFRGLKGAFSMSVKGIKHLVKYNLNTQIIMSLYRDNLAKIEDMVYFAGNLGVQSLKINPVMPIGRAHKMVKMNSTLSVEELIETSHLVRNHFQSKTKLPIYFSLPIAFQPVTKIMKKKNPECAILNILGIVENGDISFCGIQKVENDLVMGNIDRDRLDAIWKTHPLLKSIRDSLPGRMEGICGMCFFKKICLGTCRASAYHMEKNLTAPYWFCQEAFEKGLFPETRYYH